MTGIYISDGKIQKGVSGYPLIKTAAIQFIEEISNVHGEKSIYDVIKKRYMLEDCQKLNADLHKTFQKDCFDIAVHKKGKPYFKNLNLYFSVSHSEFMWICCISEMNCGIDLQAVRDVEYRKIARRHFTELENKYVDEHGIIGFYDIWVRKEALGKLTGEGVFKDKFNFASEDNYIEEDNKVSPKKAGDLIKPEKLKKYIDLPNYKAHVHEIEISEMAKCVVISEEIEKPFIRVLNGYNIEV